MPGGPELLAPGVSDPAADAGAELKSRLRRVVRRTWGFERLRPLQEEAIQAGLERRDSLVVLPTGGGKSLCYQVPPLLAGGLDIVVSPLISLMKDQLDSLRACGYPATALHSAMTPQERGDAERLLASGECRLALVSPERLAGDEFLDRLARLGVRAFAVDEAHCISHWGHDFRPEYRQLARLKTRFPGTSLHAYTATATQRVRRDIIEQLRLQDPRVLVGRFDRPNLVYRIVPRSDAHRQTLEVIERHRDQAVIVYCITRRETEELAAYLRSAGVDADHYHGGMEADARRRTQDAFASENLQVVVATVAFGMGIDRSDVRCVVHAGCPKSLEHYQQETGRAGRDGLEAECVLLYSPADVLRWQSLLQRSSAQADASAEALAAGMELLEQMRRFTAPGTCRHRSLSEHFGQAYPARSCDACDTCLGEHDALEDGTELAQKVLSCVARVGERFGVGHVVDVLRGADTERIRQLGHDGLSTYGLLRNFSKSQVTGTVFQLIDQDLLSRSVDDYPVLRLNEASWRVLRAERRVMLLPQRARRVKQTSVEKQSWEGVDTALFDKLRALRTRIARERGVPPYVIFSDASLRAMAREQPRSDAALLQVHGVGEKKLADLGRRFLEVIDEHAATA